MVFQTAPPHPASKARITWSPQLVGGPEASQNGLGQRIPAKLVVRSATDCLRDGTRRALSIGYGIDYFAPAVDAIAAGVIFGIGGPAGGAVHDDGPVIECDASGFAEQSGQA